MIVTSMHKLDLHGTRHSDVRSKLINFIEDNWNSSEDLEVITGHSTKMKGVVINILEEYNLSYNIGSMFDTLAPKIIFWIK